eukprot:comp18099_c0_seq1/m.18735 comp18099_c0_seq1/g.18735  ORF comp18099_c0_seq1/g.18735 comp18099_c0_seq1/m.18735 type:complete len:269 (-) comp18099_c0_seq1:119-925(-)
MEPLGVCAPTESDRQDLESQFLKNAARTKRRRDQRNFSHYPTWYRTKQSFVSPAQKRALTELMPIHGLRSLYSDDFNFEAVFERSAPVVLDVGFGMGDSIMGMAEMFPEKNFVGIEMMKAGVGATLKRIDASKLTNVKIVGGDAMKVLRNNVREESVHELCVFFPDPWTKMGDDDRRIVRGETLPVYERVLVPGGLMHIATDVDEYAQHVMDVFGMASERWRGKVGDGESGFWRERPEWRPKTLYETRSLEEGKRIWDFCYEYLGPGQ